MISDGFEVAMLHGVLGTDPFGVVVFEHLRQQVESLLRHQLIVLIIDVLVPLFLGELLQNVVVVGVKRYLILLHVRHQLLSTQNLGDLD